MTNLVQGLHPVLVQLAVKHQVICKHEGIEWIMVQGYRTPEQQMGYYMEGRALQPDGTWKELDRKKVRTDALPEHDPHCRRAAYDIAILVDGKISWEAEPLYRKAGAIGEELGLVWGGEFKRIHDLGHFELKNWRELPPPTMGGGPNV